jgi:hypothetical protein
MGLALRGDDGVGVVLASEGGVGWGAVMVGGGGTGCLFAVLCPPHADSNSVVRIATPIAAASGRDVRWKGTTSVVPQSLKNKMGFSPGSVSEASGLLAQRGEM